MEKPKSEQEIAVVVPCHNEATTVQQVVSDFRKELPLATIYVIDNNSTDETAQLALAAGAKIIREPRQGKGYVIETIFSAIDADIYIMVDGDDTYPADAVHKLIEPVASGQADMAIGARLANYTDTSFRPLHVFGNHLVKTLINKIFGAELRDILSGYRVFNRKVVQRVPVVSAGFEVETEMTIQMLYNQLHIVEREVAYRHRPDGSESKLRTFSDGFRILWTLFNLFRSVKPLTFFGGIAIVLFTLGFVCGIPPINDYFSTPDHYVHHVPLAILAASLVLLSAGFVFLGVLLHAINWRFKELHNVLVRSRKY